MNQLYLECLSGISGDMFVAAMLDLGADEKVLKDVLDTIPVHGFQTKISRVKKAGLDVCDFDVILDDQHENHDHDMTYLYDKNHKNDEKVETEAAGIGHHDHTEEHAHSHNEEYAHNHDKEHVHSHNEGHVHNHDEEHVHSHNEEYAHNHDKEHVHSHNEGHVHNHDEEHMHSHNEEYHTHGHGHDETHHTHHHHEHRGMKEVLDIINMTQMSEKVKALAIRIFTILGEAEAKAHGTTLEEVHFHEVGAVDSIVDIIAAAVCLDQLQLTEVILPVLYEGTGKIRCQHGMLPVPVPAVSNIISANHLALHITDMEAELVTPTGAAIAAAIRTKDQLPEHFTIRKIGIGAGKRNYKSPSLLRAMLIEEQPQKNTQQNTQTSKQEKKQSDVIYRLESNIDDCTGENFGYVMERLMEAGARDVNYTPVFMKKNRPAYQLNVICKEEDVEHLEDIIFAETTTIGIRKIAMERSILKRELCEIETTIGTAKVKICEWNQKDGRMKKIYPEYESITQLCKRSGMTFSEAFQLVERTAYDRFIR